MDCIATDKCRACLSQSSEMYPLFEAYENDLSLAVILQNFLNVEMNSYEDLPKTLCQHCANVVIEFYNFSVIFFENLLKLRPPDIYQENVEEQEVEYINDEQMYIKDIDQPSPVTLNNVYISDELTQKDLLDGETIQIEVESTPKSVTKQTQNKSLHLLKRHLKLHAQNKKFICEVCGYVSLKKSYLIDHMEMHTSEKPYKCGFCGKNFKRRSVFCRHKRIHTNPKGIICEMCGKTFTDRGTLKTHILLLHIKSRDFTCIICNQSFPLKGTLDKHLRRHQQKGAANKNFSCTECNMQYFDKSSLKRHYHMKHSSMNVKEKCQFCGKEYTAKSTLFKHIKGHHKEQ